MLIKRKIAVKVVVTEQFKRQLLAEMSAGIDRIKQTRQQLERDGARYLAELQSKDSSQGAAFRQRLSEQKREQDELLLKLSEKKSAAEELELGSEYSQGSLEGLVDVQVGDNLFEALNCAEIVIKDAVVLEIRHN